MQSLPTPTTGRARTFTAAGRAFYERLTLIASDGRVVKVFYTVLEPERNAADVAACG